MLLKHVRELRTRASEQAVGERQANSGGVRIESGADDDQSVGPARTLGEKGASSAIAGGRLHREGDSPETRSVINRSPKVALTRWSTAGHCQSAMSDPRTPQIPVPDIRRDLEQRITQGEFAVGQRLPSEYSLASEYSSTRTRVRTALAALARGGLVSSRANAGWFVEVGRQAQNVNQIVSFSEWAKQHGRRFGGRIVQREYGPATAREARMFGIGLGVEIVRFTRIRLLDERPVMVERSTWAPWAREVIDGLPDDTSSMFVALADAGIRAFLGDHRIEAASASNEDALLLGIRRSGPVLQVIRSTVTSERRVIEIATDRYLPDLVAFDVSGSSIARTLLPRG
jgi:GntR family transcriptional regulator